jgi:hypothetical protein
MPARAQPARQGADHALAATFEFRRVARCDQPNPQRGTLGKRKNPSLREMRSLNSGPL